MKRAIVAGIFAMTGVVCPQAHAADYPSQSIRIVVPFAPGGGADLPARLLAEKLSAAWRQAVVVENRPGATGTIGESHVARADADGYTVLLATPSSHTIGPQLIKNLSFDPLKDFKPAILFGWVPNVLVVNPAVKATTLDDLIALAKSKPGALNYSSSGDGSSIQLTTEIFAQKAGVKLTQIPYAGVSPAVTAVMAGQVDMMFAPAALALPQVRAGKLRQLTSLPAANDAKIDWSTLSSPEAPHFYSAGWLGFLFPAKTPDGVVQKWQSEIARIIQSPDVQEKFRQMSLIPSTISGEEFEKLIRSDYTQSSRILKELRIDPS